MESEENRIVSGRIPDRPRIGAGGPDKELGQGYANSLELLGELPRMANAGSWFPRIAALGR